MKRRFLVVVRAGDRSLHPQWLQTEARNWDLIVHYYGDAPQRYPTSGDGMLRVDSKGAKWPTLQDLLSRTRDAWREYDYIWIPDEDLAVRGDDINRMFELVEALKIELAQPSFAWGEHRAGSVLALHNPNFAVRYSSFVEPTAPCFSRALLERVVPTFAESGSGAGLGYVWPRFLPNAPTQCAILDRIQVTLTRQPVHGDDDARHAAMDRLLAKFGAADAIPLSYGAIDRDGRRYNLFDAENGEFVFRLCEGWLATLADKPELLGAVFTAHAMARAEYLSPAAATAAAASAQPAPAAEPAHGSAALERFKSALAAAAANGAGRVAATAQG